MPDDLRHFLSQQFAGFSFNSAYKTPGLLTEMDDAPRHNKIKGNRKMNKIDTIMVAVDFSKYSLDVVAVATDLAQKLDAELVFVNVINQRDLNTVEHTLNRLSVYNNSLSLKGYVEELMEDRREKMKTLLANSRWEKGKSYHLIFKKGVPFEELVKAVHNESVDLVVMGNKGRSNISGVLFGSTAERMFRHCPVPLLSVREKK